MSEIETALPTYRVSEKQLLLLRAIERKTSYPGQSVGIVPSFDFPLAWAEREEELSYLLSNLLEQGLIRSAEGSPHEQTYGCVLTATGWQFLDAHARPSIISNQVFIAMSFAPELLAAWTEGIGPAVRRAGYQPYRVDAQPHVDRIDTKIMSEIKNSRFVVADVTLQRPGVYFEAGYAMGLGIPVFWCVRKDDLPNIHFDTRQYNHVIWEAPSDLAEQLHAFFSVVVGPGSTAT